MATVKLATPWSTYYKELEILFGRDPEIRILYYDEEKEVKLYVDNSAKADALTQLLPKEKVFGNIVLKITVIPKNGMTATKFSLFEEAFRGNPIVSYTKKLDGTFPFTLCYIVFKHEVAQYYNDDLGDVNGMCSTLYQDIAKRIFENRDNVYFCTDVLDDDTGLSLGRQKYKWP